MRRPIAAPTAIAATGIAARSWRHEPAAGGRTAAAPSGSGASVRPSPRATSPLSRAERNAVPSGSPGRRADSRRGPALPRSRASAPPRCAIAPTHRRAARRARPSRPAAAAGAARPCASSRSRPTRRAPGTASATRCGGRPAPACRRPAASGTTARPATRLPRSNHVGGALVVVQRPEVDEADVLHVLPLRRAGLEALARAA